MGTNNKGIIIHQIINVDVFIGPKSWYKISLFYF